MAEENGGLKRKSLSSGVSAVFLSLTAWLLLSGIGSQGLQPARGTGLAITVEHFSVGNSPYALAFDGANIWVANYFSNNVTVLNAATGALVNTYNAGTYPAGLAWDSDNSNMWIVNAGSFNVTVRTNTGGLVRTVPVGRGPIGAVYANGRIWVANWDSGLNNTLSVLDASTGSHLITPTVGAGPFGMAYDGVNVWSTNSASESLSVLDVTSGQTLISPTVGSAPLAVAFEGSRAWATNYNDHTINVVQLSDGKVVMTPTVGVQPWGIAFDGTYMWVANSGDDTVWVLDVLSGGLVVSTTVGDKPQGLVFDGTSMWVTNKDSHTVSRLTLGELPAPTTTGTTTRTPTVTKTGTPFYGAYFPLAMRQATYTPTRTPTPTRTATPLPAATIERPRLLDGYYSTNLTGREISFYVINNGATARNAYYRFPSGGLCYTVSWFFGTSTSISNGSFYFADLRNRYGIPAVSLSCRSTSSSSADCTAQDSTGYRYCSTLMSETVYLR